MSISVKQSRPAARPLLGVIACNRRVGGEVGASVKHRYLIAASRHADASLVIIPSLPDGIDAPRLARMVDGVLLTGSPSNMRPSRYNECALGEGPFDDGRDETALRLIDAMNAAHKPILGICRGVQEINVALGGTLRRNLRGDPALLAHHAPDDVDLETMFTHRHEVRFAPGGVLARIAGSDRAIVNSVHYQGIDLLAPGLFVEARANDGMIEAVSADLGRAPLLAVQWHPEWRTDEDAASQAVFALFGSLMRGATLTGLAGAATQS